MPGEFDIAGWDDIAGDDDVGLQVGMEIGRRRALGRPIPPRLRAAAAQLQGSQSLVKGPVMGVGPYGTPLRAAEQTSMKALYQVFGLGTLTTAGAGAGSLSQVFQEHFRPERLTLAETVAGNGSIGGIFIGVRPQQANTGAIPLSAFLSTAFETRVQFDTGAPGQSFTINITHAAAGTSSGMAFGTVIKH